MKKLYVALVALLLTATAAQAQGTFRDAAGAQHSGVVAMCLNAAGLAIPAVNGSDCSGGGAAATIADGADVAEGSTTDAAATAGSTGTVSAKLRTITTQLNVKGYQFQLAPTITVDAGAYAAGDSLGGLITLSGAARTAGGTGILNGIRLKSTGGSTNTIWIYAWSKTPTATCTNNAAYVPNAADNAYALVGFPTSVVMGNAPGAWDTSTYAQVTALISNFKNQDTVPSTELKICLVTAGAVTPASTTDLSMNAVGMQD